MTEHIESKHAASHPVDRNPDASAAPVHSHPHPHPSRRVVTALYTCPMHPEVREPRPGTCPKCGMALEKVAAAPRAAPTEWVCPMHPEIVRDRPGTCPICGMALEPRTPAPEEENPELRDMSRRFWFALALTVLLVLLAMADLSPIIAAAAMSFSSVSVVGNALRLRRAAA